LSDFPQAKARWFAYYYTRKWGNDLQKVSCCDKSQWRHAGWETVGEKFPIEVNNNGVMPGRKPFAKGFCPDETQWCHAGQETMGKKFPAPMKRNGVMPDRETAGPCLALRLLKEFLDGPMGM